MKCTRRKPILKKPHHMKRAKDSKEPSCRGTLHNPLCSDQSSLLITTLSLLSHDVQLYSPLASTHVDGFRWPTVNAKKNTEGMSDINVSSMLTFSRPAKESSLRLTIMMTRASESRAAGMCEFMACARYWPASTG